MPPNQGESTKADLRQSLGELLEGGEVRIEQVRPLESNIKRKREE